ncbi:DUF6252 family protein [Flagellimonas nanhaiensis]|uniref:Lipoprotein n=1 Tax=Flagellimonas nanhaiensis TaxID=2292706 RepID=A0A371JTX1_9FLAO|nr:DUF6252 family protein [Allomuricauda nanhaiensis]RDY61261.1 hypothetical protein DX873_03580 [Allomuricauda nanhaiensis]
MKKTPATLRLLPITLLPFYLFTLVSCSNDDGPKNPVDALPPITQTGENTFACLINGKPFFSNKDERGVDYVFNTLTIYGFNRSDTGIILTGLEIEGDVSEGQFPLESRLEGQYSALYLERGGLDSRIETTNQLPGQIIITRFDLEEFIVSGTFEFSVKDDEGKTLNFTDGRFDLKF